MVMFMLMKNWQKIGSNTGKRITDGTNTRIKIGRVIESGNKRGSGTKIGGTRGNYTGRAKYCNEEKGR